LFPTVQFKETAPLKGYFVSSADNLIFISYASLLIFETGNNHAILFSVKELIEIPVVLLLTLRKINSALIITQKRRHANFNLLQSSMTNLPSIEFYIGIVSRDYAPFRILQSLMERQVSGSTYACFVRLLPRL
jgi:hypothetical protein